MLTTQLYRSRLWDRTDIDPAKLAHLVYSIQQAGWREGTTIEYEMYEGQAQIVCGHRRTLAVALAEKFEKTDIPELITQINSLSVSPLAVKVCPFCEAQVYENRDVCTSCNEGMYSDDEWLAIDGEIMVEDPDFFVNNYNDIVHGVEVDIPATEISFKDDMTTQLTMLEDNSLREDVDVIGLAIAVDRAVKLGATAVALSRLGINNTQRKYYVAVANAPDFVREAIRAGRLALSVPFNVMAAKDANKIAAIYEIIQNYNVTTVNGVKEVVKRIKNYIPPTAAMDDSPATANSKSVIATALGKIDPIKKWVEIGLRGTITQSTIQSVITPEDMVALEMECESCPLGGKMSLMARVRGFGYPCQEDPNYTGGCVGHSEQVYADFSMADESCAEYGDGSHWFADYEAAFNRYGPKNPAISEADEVEETGRPIDNQRARFAKFIAESEAMNGADHPMATLCSDCAYRLDTSPTSDVSVPHCAWCKHRSTTHIGYLVDEGNYKIPMCYQFSPLTKPVKLVPDTKFGGIRSLDTVIDSLGQQLALHRFPIMRRLTGVPNSASESYADWFWKMLKESNFRDEQKATLVQWLAFEVEMSDGGSGVLYLKGGRPGTFKFVDF